MRVLCLIVKLCADSIECSPSEVESIVSMSDNAPEGLIQSLEYFNDAAKVGTHPILFERMLMVI